MVTLPAFTPSGWPAAVRAERVTDAMVVPMMRRDVLADLTRAADPGR